MIVYRQPMKIGNSVWPSEYRTVMSTYSSTTSSAAVGNAQLTFLANSFGDGTKATNGVGPATGGAAPFTTNYPSGLKGMIQTPSAGGTAICPYTQYRILASKIYYRIVPSPVGAQAVSGMSSDIRVVCFPTTQLNYSGSSFSQLIEQNHAKYHVISPGYFGTSSTTAITGAGAPLASQSEKFHSHVCGVSKIFGLPRSVVHNDANFWADYGSVVFASQPTNKVYWQLFIIGDGTGAWAGNIEVIVKHDTVFFGRNYDLATSQNN